MSLQSIDETPDSEASVVPARRPGQGSGRLPAPPPLRQRSAEVHRETEPELESLPEPEQVETAEEPEPEQPAAPVNGVGREQPVPPPETEEPDTEDSQELPQEPPQESREETPQEASTTPEWSTTPDTSGSQEMDISSGGQCRRCRFSYRYDSSCFVYAMLYYLLFNTLLL